MKKLFSLSEGAVKFIEGYAETQNCSQSNVVDLSVKLFSLFIREEKDIPPNMLKEMKTMYPRPRAARE